MPGSPDITVTTPVLDTDEKAICFQKASRGHHMDVGRWKGTSTAPGSTGLWQEGAAIEPFFLVKDGHFGEEGCRILLEPAVIHVVRAPVGSVTSRLT